MNEPETFEEWKVRTAPSPESVEFARTATLPTYVAAAFVILLLSRFEYGEKLALLGFLGLWFPTGVIKRRWLSSGMLLDDRPFVLLRWVRLALFLVLLTVISLGSARDLVLAAVFGVVAVAEMRWHFVERAGAAFERRRL